MQLINYYPKYLLSILVSADFTEVEFNINLKSLSHSPDRCLRIVMTAVTDTIYAEAAIVFDGLFSDSIDFFLSSLIEFIPLESLLLYTESNYEEFKKIKSGRKEVSTIKKLIQSFLFTEFRDKFSYPYLSNLNATSIQLPPIITNISFRKMITLGLKNTLIEIDCINSAMSFIMKDFVVSTQENYNAKVRKSDHYKISIL